MRFSRLSCCFLPVLFLLLLSPTSSFAQEQDDVAEQVPLESIENSSQTALEAEKKANTEDENKIIWESHESVAGTFTTKFPKKYQYNIFPFQFNDTDVAYSAEIYADLNETADDSKKTEKSVFIHSVHTFGQEMSGARAKKTLDSFTLKYKSMAKFLKGTLIKDEDSTHNGYLSKDLYITYHKNPDISSSFEDKTAIRINLYATNHAIVEQVITGPATDMYSYRFDDFFESIRLQDGIGQTDIPIGTGWVSYASPNNVFTIKVPPVNKDYTPEKPAARATQKRDRLAYKIVDPVVGSTLYYYVTSYKLQSTPSMKDITNLLVQNHISKFVENIKGSSIGMNKKQTKTLTTYETSIVVSPRKNLPYITKLIFLVEVQGDFVLVKEFQNGIHHYDSGIEKTFFNLTTFHPEKYKYTPPKKN